jgi:hypothetical protein
VEVGVGTMKNVRNIAGRLSLGSFMEVLSIVAITSSGLGLAGSLIYGAPFGMAAINFALGIVSILILGLVSFPAYCWAARNRRITPLTIVTKNARQPEDGQLSSESAPCASSDEVSSWTLDQT